MFIWRFVGFVPKSVTRTRAPLTTAVSKASLGMKDVVSNMMMKVTIGEKLRDTRQQRPVQKTYGIYMCLRSMNIKYVSRRSNYLL